MPPRTWIDCTLGELIRDAREARGMTRSKLAEFTGITANSLIRYELAGTPDGKYPPVKKLVLICEVLEIDPRNAFDAIKVEDYRAQPVPPPDQELNNRFGLRFTEHFRSTKEWNALHQSLDLSVIEAVMANIAERMAANDERLSRMENALKSARHFALKNGSDQNDPSRPEATSNNPEAVGAASTNHTKGRD